MSDTLSQTILCNCSHERACLACLTTQNPEDYLPELGLLDLMCAETGYQDTDEQD